MIELTTSAAMDTIWRAPAIVFVLTMEAGLALTPNVSNIITLMGVILLKMVINTLTTTTTMDTKMIHLEQIISYCYLIYYIIIKQTI